MKITEAEFLAVLNGAVKVAEDTGCCFITALSKIQSLANLNPKLKANKVVIDAAHKLKMCFLKGINTEVVRLLGIEKWDFIGYTATYSKYSKVYDEQRVAHYWICISKDGTEKFKLPFNGSVLRTKSVRKIQTMRLGLEPSNRFVEGQDEFDGLCQAAQNGENPYRCTIMCANTALNTIG